MAVSFYVAECREFPSMGRYYEGITDVKKACGLYRQFVKESVLNGIPCIGVSSGDAYMDVVSGTIDLDMLCYYHELQSTEALTQIKELIKEFPQKEVVGKDLFDQLCQVNNIL